ncbi:MAG TPA: GldM family protein [Bacteroidales bacterium]|nr:GldM family protein [Bacteroidales bacterium]
MKNQVILFLNVFVIAFLMVSCGNKEQKVNSEGIESSQITVKSDILDEYGKLMPGCKNLISVEVEGIDVAEALIYLDEDAGDAYIEETGVSLVPYKGGSKVKMIVSFKDKGGTKEFEVEKSLPAPQLRFFNAETNVIQDYDIENVATVVVEIVADDTFAKLFPLDSKYRITSFDAVLMRAEDEIKSISVKEEYDSNQINISTLQDAAEKGDYIVINIWKIERQDFEGNWHDVEVPEKAKEITLKI